MAYFDSDGVQIYFEEHGKGEPVVLVHGFASRAEHNWGAMNWFTTLAPHYRVVALDCRGHGKSGKPHDPAAYGGETMGDDVIRLMDHLGIKRTLIMGYSMGGRIVTGLLMIASGASARGGARRNRRGVGVGAIFRPQTDRRCDARRRYVHVSLTSVRGSFANSRRLTGNDLKALAACMGSNREDFTAEQIAAKKIRVPVMIVIGTKDLLVGNPTLLRDAIPGQQAGDARRTRSFERARRHAFTRKRCWNFSSPRRRKKSRGWHCCIGRDQR